MIRSFCGLSFHDKHRVWMAEKLTEMAHAKDADLEWSALLWDHVVGCVPLADAARAEIRRRTALEADEPALRGRDLRVARIQRVLDACPREAAEAVPILGDAIAVIANLVGEDIAVTLAHVLRNHASTGDAIRALSIVERLRAEVS